MSYRGFDVVLCVPCFNEEATIAKVIRDFWKVMPEIRIFVFDNESNDRTAAIARENGARVLRVPLRGKGNVVRRMFADVDADIYIMVDGDATYDAESAPEMVNKLVDEQLDMVVGCRVTSPDIANAAYRPGHRFGNRLLTRSVAWIFGGELSDMLSGYRVFSRRYAKSFPSLSKGFEIETELTVHALELRMPCGETRTFYGARMEGSQSKLSTWRDGWIILKTIARLYIAERPFAFFGIAALLLFLFSLLIAVPVFIEYFHTGLVPRFPTAFLAASVMVCSLLSFACGLILDNVTRGRQELKRLAYLTIRFKMP
jgi:glycosyltransferase involved in cell wall biosynthesis